MALGGSLAHVNFPGTSSTSHLPPWVAQPLSPCITLSVVEIRKPGVSTPGEDKHMAADPGVSVADAGNNHTSTEGGSNPHHGEPAVQNNPEPKIINTDLMNLMAPPTDVTPLTSPYSPPLGSESQRPRSRISRLLRRRSQTLSLGNNSDSAPRMAGVQKPSARPQDSAVTTLRSHGSTAELRRSGTEVTRKRMYSMLAAASKEKLAESSMPTAREMNETPTSALTIVHPRPIPMPTPLRLDQDVEMLEAQMLPPQLPLSSPRSAIPTNSNGLASVLASGNLPQAVRDDSGAAGGSVKSGGLTRSASSGSQTVTIFECPILEVDEGCGAGSEEDLSFLSNDQELEQIMAMSSASASSRRQNGQGGLLFKRSHEAAMQCSQVVRNVPRMRRRRERKIDRRRQSLTMSESTICLSSTPSPTPVL